jgi:hypothetical protein
MAPAAKRPVVRSGGKFADVCPATRHCALRAHAHMVQKSGSRCPALSAPGVVDKKSKHVACQNHSRDFAGISDRAGNSNDGVHSNKNSD